MLDYFELTPNFAILFNRRIVCRELEVEPTRAKYVEEGLMMLNQLLMNKTFLLHFVRTMEANKYFEGKVNSFLRYAHMIPKIAAVFSGSGVCGLPAHGDPAGEDGVLHRHSEDSACRADRTHSREAAQCVAQNSVPPQREHRRAITHALVSFVKEHLICLKLLPCLSGLHS